MALFECLQESDCMKKENRPLRDCLAEVDEGHDCHYLRNALFLCKRGQLDMRTRMRGPRVH